MVGQPTRISRLPVPGSSKLSEELRISYHKDGAVVLDIRSGKLLSANTVGARILRLLQEGSDRDEIVGRISQEFAEPAERVQGDVEQFLGRLKSRGMLQE
jgi:hypothetical protein